MTPAWHEVGFRLSLPTGPGTKLILSALFQKAEKMSSHFNFSPLCVFKHVPGLFDFPSPVSIPKLQLSCQNKFLWRGPCPSPEKMHAGVRDRCVQTRTIPRQRRGNSALQPTVTPTASLPSSVKRWIHSILSPSTKESNFYVAK